MTYAISTKQIHNNKNYLVLVLMYLFVDLQWMYTAHVPKGAQSNYFLQLMRPEKKKSVGQVFLLSY